MKLILTAALLAATTLSTVGLAAPVHAATAITIDSPNGDEYDSGAEVVVSGFNASDYTETIYVECDESFSTPTADVDPGSFSVSVGTFNGPDACRIRDYYSDDLLASFTVAGPPTTVSDPSVDHDIFYPYVRDGYRDTVGFKWRQDRRGRALITVVNSDGRTVRAESPMRWRGRNGWVWNGRKDNGELAAEGRYRIKVTVNANTVSARVSARSATVTRTFRQRKEGNQATSLATRGSCYARRDSYYQVATLDCWGGRYAKANYRIAIPAAAFDVRGTVDLRRSSANICCHGRITKGWSRPSNRMVALWAKVTGWRATDVNFVRVVYKQKVRI